MGTRKQKYIRKSEVVIRAAALFSVLALLLVPALDQLGCTFSSPSWEMTDSAKSGRHSESGVQIASLRAMPVKGHAPLHMHFCLLHATSITLTQLATLVFQLQSIPLSLPSQWAVDSLATDFFHPPVA